MKAAIHNPYLDTLGGGEKYTFSFVKALINFGYQVDVEWVDESVIKKAEDRFGLELPGVRVVKDINRGDGYDVCFWVSDGSIPTLKARNNILHFQVPFTGVGGKTLLNKMKLFRINHVVCNSNFTKGFIDKEFGVNSIVIYPPIEVPRELGGKKENIILYVGRFSNLLQSKRQDVLIDSFKKLLKQKIGKWKLVLAGGSEIGAENFLKSLHKSATNLPIEIVERPSFEKLMKLYGKAKIFWSAAGYEIKEQKEPQKVEHFGLTVIEAMSFGVVPLCYNAGGHKELIDNGKNGYLWDKEKELIETTFKLIKYPDLLKSIAHSAVVESKKYDYSVFVSDVKNVL